MKSLVFIGHSECCGLSVERLREIIVKCIEDGTTNFLNGGFGNFDYICAKEVFKLKKQYPHIKNILVIPYLTFKNFKKEFFDEIVYPEGFEKYHFKVAIPERNKYMVNNSQIAVCFINHSWGNAVKTYEYAKKRDKEIINLSVYKGDI